MMEEGWKQQQANMQRVMQENRQREEMIRQRQQEERYKQMMGMDLNASLRPWNQTPTGNRFVASPNVFNPLGSASIAGFGLGPVAPSIGTLPTHYTALPPVNPIQMLGVPGRFGMPQSSGQPFHMQAGEFFGLGVR
jgi:hypothetical protein